ncbi:MAG: hypothetical protein P8104_12785, partial [Gammaproteobacteria bacterium]
DPAFAVVPDITSWLSRYRSSTPEGTAAFIENYASVVVNTADLNTLALDGVAVDTSAFSTIPGTTYSCGTVDLPLGRFELEAASPFMMMLGGGSRADSYLTIGGANFAAGITPYSVGIMPPAELNLDGMAISTGQFNLVDVIGYSDSRPEGIDLLDTPIVIDATIGGAAFHELLTIPNDVEVLNLIGFFEATDPVKPRAQFDYIMGPIGRTGPAANTIALPLQTANWSYQITDLETGHDVFVDNNDPKPMVSNSPLSQVLETFEDNNTTWYVGYDTPQSLRQPGQFQPHGTIGTPTNRNNDPVNNPVNGPDIPSPLTCDIDGSGVVDQLDINMIFAARNQAAVP